MQAELLKVKGEEYAKELAVVGAPKTAEKKAPAAKKAGGGGGKASHKLDSMDDFPTMGA